jgi:peptide/nickel transport system substrate-binding protein
MRLAVVAAACAALVAFGGLAPAGAKLSASPMNIIASRSKEAGTGLFNVGGYSNKRVDELTRMIQVETDQKRRMAEIFEAIKIHKDEFGHIPLRQQTVVWAAHDNIDLVQFADDFVPLCYVEVK